MLEEDDGPRAIAGLKSYDSRFNFYPSFPKERSLVLDFRAAQIHHLSAAVEIQREQIKSQHKVTDPYDLSRGNKHRKKFVKRMSLLAEQIEKYSMSSRSTYNLCFISGRANQGLNLLI